MLSYQSMTLTLESLNIEKRHTVGISMENGLKSLELESKFY